MSGVAIVNALLSADSGVTALVPAARIFSGAVALPTQLPVVSVHMVDNVEAPDVQMSGSRFITERVQVTIYAASYSPKMPFLRAARDACVGQRGSVAGHNLDGITPEVTGPDLDDPVAGIFEQSIDLLVKWTT